jgi:hypothetical protein
MKEEREYHHSPTAAHHLYTISILVQMAASLNQELQEPILQSLDADASITDTLKLVLQTNAQC